MIRKYFGFNICTKLLMRLRVAAIKTGRTATEIIISGIEWELDRISKTPENKGVDNGDAL